VLAQVEAEQLSFADAVKRDVMCEPGLGVPALDDLAAGHGPVQGTGEMGPVSTDDVTTMILELAGGGSAKVTVSRIATGVPNSLGFQIIGSEGSVSFDSVRPDEFLLYQRTVAGPESNGPRQVIVGPEQPSFAYTIPMPARGVGSGYGAAFVAQTQDFLGAILGHGKVSNDFWTGYQTMLVCDAAQQAAAEGSPVDIAALDATHRAAATTQEEITA
jgi:predicted dehydrogenase